MPVPRRCSGCGAALGEPTDDDLTIVCRFCGLRHDINQLAGEAAPVVVQLGRPMTSAVRAVVGIILFIAAVSVAIVLFVAYRAAEVATRVPDTIGAAQQRNAERNRPLSPTELGTWTEYAWKTVETAPPPGGFDAFDPVTALPWGMTIARAWASDAQLTRIDVGRVTTTGVVDVSGDIPSGYRFYSPARVLRWKQETDAGTKSTTATGLMLEVQGGEVRVLMDTSTRDEPATPAPVSLPLPELLARARTSRSFGDRPFYAAYMIHVRREGWAWYFRAPSGDTFPRVRARDGRVYPY